MSERSFMARVGSFLARPGTIVIVAFLLRFGIFFYLRSQGPFPVTNTLEIGYETGRIARSLAAGEGYASPLSVATGPTAWMTPLFPLLLAAVFKIFGIYSWTSYLVISAMDCAFSALTGWVVYAIGARAFGRTCGIVAGWIWVFLPPAITYPIAWVWDMSLSALLFSLVMLATLYMLDSERPAAWAGYGALWGVGAMTNAAMVSTLPFLMGWLAVELRARGARWLQLALIAMLIFVLVISPWFIRNYVVFHRLILFRSNFGLELWLGNNPSNPGIWSWWLHPNDDDGERKLFGKLGEIAYMNVKQHEALDWIRANPAQFLNQTMHRFMDNWTGVDEPLEDVLHGPWYLVAILLVNMAFPLFALPGALVAYRRRNPYAFPFASAVIFFPLVYYVTHTTLRYRHPIDPVLCVLAALAAVAPFSVPPVRSSGAPVVSGPARQNRESATAG
ncbi:MAG TPA: glycosyltransferase family 39 protein [Candidatus Acidoferrales bacterium]|nr:glycosyltransferase family 39 protein [Candidatus Acidoferrales bacterium]